ncbi:Aromatic acid exporter family member 1 [Tepidibacter thalassicus DSM 15285]|uniref:Aromatic acid exporter family member 1 n=2 Tax=Tepidibacter TaxID=214904 RepID=A0A1M5PK02_9FIRM|nr:Aromatic acid exporter family member 1 [Tepidibacter thalassicus DSM 15285]
MRNIKTAIAVSLSIAVSKFLDMEYPFYAAIAAIISMQNSVIESFKVGRNRMLGTILGAIVGLVFYAINPTSTVLSGIGIIVIIYICNLLRWNKSVTIAGIVFCVIMTNLDGRDPVFYALNRVFDTLLGITVAVLVNYFIAPLNSLERILKECDETVKNLISIVKYKIIDDIDVDLKEFYNKVSNLERDLKEFRFKKDEKIKIDNVNEVINICKKVYFYLQIIEALEGNCNLNRENYNRLVDLYGSFNKKIKDVDSDVDVVFNYNLDKIINYIEILNSIEYKCEKKRYIEMIS